MNNAVLNIAFFAAASHQMGRPKAVIPNLVDAMDPFR